MRVRKWRKIRGQGKLSAKRLAEIDAMVRRKAAQMGMTLEGSGAAEAERLAKQEEKSTDRKKVTPETC